MTALAVLRRLLAIRGPDAGLAGLDPNILRFVVELDRVVDTAIVRVQVAALVEVDVAAVQFFPLFDERPGPEEPRGFGVFYVLQFPGVERTDDAPALFSIAHELADALAARTVEPDLGVRIFPEPALPMVQPEGVEDSVVGLCFVSDAVPPDPLWALDRAGVSAAWAAYPARGAGVRIGQPDTGVTRHVELSDIDIRDGFNVFDNTPDPTDPLGAEGHPGHGTGTASVVASGSAGRVDGPAPAATLVPIRCIESVILTFNGSAVAKAIDYARRQGCDIITMSLGGVPSRAIESAVTEAVAAGIIVLAAAGNCVRLVVYPARYDNVIAVAGSNVRDAPWPGSCRGAEVDITAPAENVWRAIAGPSGDQVAGGQGTSFAVAITAGAAGLWLSHHGKQAVADAASRRGTTVQQLFRDCLAATARTPANWNTNDFGAGIVDARALLARPLTDPLPLLPDRAPASVTTAALLADAWGAADADRLRDVAADPRFQLELSMLALQAARAGTALPGNAGSSLDRERISPQLAAAIGWTG